MSEQLATEATEPEAILTTEPAIASETQSADSFAAPPINAAVLRCCEAAERARQDVLSGRDRNNSTHTAAHEAFAKAMPPLRGAGNIRDFIACVAYGMLINYFLESTGAKLLYAAQIAFNADIKRPSRNRKASA